MGLTWAIHIVSLCFNPDLTDLHDILVSRIAKKFHRVSGIQMGVLRDLNNCLGFSIQGNMRGRLGTLVVILLTNNLKKGLDNKIK